MIRRSPRRISPTRLVLALTAFAAAAIVAGSPGVWAQTGAAPQKKRESRASSMNKNVKFQTRVEPAEAKAGDTVTFSVTADVKAPWHIYKFAATQPAANSPRNTQFNIYEPPGLKPQGEWTADREPKREKEPAFPEIEFVEFYDKEVTWSLKLQVPPGTEAGQKTIRSQVYFQVCSSGPGGQCSIPGWFALPEVMLNVLPGGAAAPVSTTTEKPPNAEPVATAQPASQPSPVPPAPVAKTASTQPASDVQRALQQGLLPFLLLAMSGGLLALVTPCVWPMVPVTVNFFVKQGQTGHGRTLGLAITYCLSIIGVFTLVGVAFSAVFGAAYLQRLANAAWLNILVAVLFFAFGMSLLGLFEFRLPSFLLNASAKGEGRGGLIGVFFMALTLTITSFTCTFPVVGGLLVMAASGNAFYPIIGLATFAAVIAFPFFILALVPSLATRLPRSGDWMNAVKVVGGLIEVGAAFKFINNAECAFVVPEDAWFNAQTVLTIWAVLALVCGLYLLGLFKTDHDHGEVRIGPIRILAGSLFIGLAMYVTPALFGRPPQGPIWDRLIVGMLPADAGKLRATVVAGGSSEGSGCREVKATSTEPKVAERQAVNCHGVGWGMSYQAALERARAENRPVLIDFTGVNCANCRLMEENVMPKPEIVKLLNQFITVQLYTDFVPISSITADQREELAATNQDLLAKLANDNTNPFYAVLSPDEQLLESIGGFREPPVFGAFLNRGLTKFQDAKKVAQAGATIDR